MEWTSIELYAPFCQQSESPPEDPPDSSCCYQSQESASSHPWRHRPLQTEKHIRNLYTYIYIFFSSLSNVHRITTETHSVAGLQLWRSSGWTRLLSKTDLQASTGLILYPLYPPHTHVYQPAITLKYKYSLVIMSCTEKAQPCKNRTTHVTWLTS